VRPGFGPPAEPAAVSQRHGVTAVAHRDSVLRTSFAATAVPLRLRHAGPAAQLSVRSVRLTCVCVQPRGSEDQRYHQFGFRMTATARRRGARRTPKASVTLWSFPNRQHGSWRTVTPRRRRWRRTLKRLVAPSMLRIGDLWRARRTRRSVKSRFVSASSIGNLTRQLHLTRRRCLARG
jgi:hypothetical protein